MAKSKPTDNTDSAKPTGKQRASRIRLDHYKTWDGPTRLKWLLSGVAVVMAVGLLAWTWGSPRGMAAVSHGPVSQSHALWQSQCDACHTPGVPLRGDALSLMKGMPGAEQQRCQTCHQVAAHPNRVPDHDQACATCHREHRGANIDLKQVADAACVACHQDLTQVAKLGESQDVASIQRFPDDHPEFLSLPTKLATGDPGTLKFSHSRHMRLGLTTSADSKPSEQMTYDELPEAQLARYLAEGQDVSHAVQLACASCHEMQTSDGSTGTLTTAQPGVFLPVSYEQHCQACHPLSTLPDGAAGSVESVPALLPHGLQPEEIEAFLTRTFRSEWFDTAGNQQQQDLARPVPGRSRILRDQAAPAIADRVEKNLGHFAQRCQQCHQMQDNNASDHNLAVRPTNVPSVWLEKAKFDHTAHRMMQCGECHPGATKTESGLSLTERGAESREVMIPGKDNCAQCHAPVGHDTSGKAMGGVRHDCAICHRYHDGQLDKPGMPSLLDPDAGFSIDQFLQGAGDEQPAE